MDWLKINCRPVVEEHCPVALKGRHYNAKYFIFTVICFIFCMLFSFYETEILGQPSALDLAVGR
jgi:hypothetical protein